MPINTRMNQFDIPSSKPNETERSLDKELVTFQQLADKYEPIIRALLKMYSCERCGKCCREERVSSGTRDAKKLIKFNKEQFKDAVQNIVKERMFTFKLPCHYLDNNNNINNCRCYKVRPSPCKFYPFVFLYGYFISISYCPYGIKIINDILEFSKLKGITVLEQKDASGVMKDIVTKVDKFYHEDLGIEKNPDMKILNVPYSDLEEFYKWIKQKRHDEAHYSGAGNMC